MSEQTPRPLMFVTFSLDIGGIETLILEICRRIDRAQYAPHVCSFFPAGRLAPEFERMGVAVHTVEKKRALDWSLPFRLAALYKKLGIGIVHTHNPSVWLYGGLAAKIAGIPLVHTAHTPSDYKPERWGLIERFLSGFTHRVTSVSASVAQFMIEKEGVPEHKIQVILNGVKADDFDVQIDRQAKRKELGLAPGEFAFVNVARFFPNKDHATLVAAFALLRKKMPNARLLFAGDGPLREDLARQAAGLGLDGSLTFLGNRRDIPQILHAVDCFSLSSIKEGLPIVLLEAMAAGLPVVSTDVDGNPEAVEHGETGLLVPARNPDALAGAMRRMASDPAQARSMGERGRKRVREHFTFEKMVEQYYAVYGSVGGGNGK